MTRERFWKSFIGALVILSAVSACKPKAGGSCKEKGQALCASKESALVCEDGKWHDLRCRGQSGCQEVGTEIKCDQDQALLGDICLDEDTVTCSQDKKATLKCKGKKLVLEEACLGAKGCSSTSTLVECDNSLAQPGDACSVGNSCALDGKSLLRCDGAKWGVERTCKGGCAVTGRTINCN